MLKRVPREIHRLRNGRQHAVTVFANSIPKSGTHLLVQVLEALPELSNYDVMLVSKPSLPYRERTEQQLCRRIASILPGELVSGHLFHRPAFADLLRRRQVAQVFICRDPRDVAISEAMYISHMTRWHSLHGTYRRLPNDDSRIELSIRGLPPSAEGDSFYGDIRQRMLPFLGWLDSDDVCAVRYEDLMGPERASHLERIAIFVNARAARVTPDRPCEPVAATVDRMMANIVPERSRTYRQGRTAHWRERFTPDHTRAFAEVAGDLLVRMGYHGTGTSGAA